MSGVVSKATISGAGQNIFRARTILPIATHEPSSIVTILVPSSRLLPGFGQEGACTQPAARHREPPKGAESQLPDVRIMRRLKTEAGSLRPHP